MLVPWLIAPDTTLKIYLLLVLLASPLCFAAYGWDKRRAVRNGPRIPERTLHLLAFVGGWPGAWLGQRFFRHKTQKRMFRFVFWLIVILHMSFLAVAVAGLVVR